MEGEFVTKVVGHGVETGADLFDLAGVDFFGDSGYVVNNDFEVVFADEGAHVGGTFLSGDGDPGFGNAGPGGDDGFDQFCFGATAQVGEIRTFDGLI